MSRSRKLDQFYTRGEIASLCMDFLGEKFCLKDYFLLEPSAGTGSFSDLFGKKSLALDLDPKKDSIILQDFLKFDYSSISDESVFTIGNPPFGRNSSLAIKFFNRAAEFSEHIAFIVPKTFKKISTVNKLDKFFYLKHELELPADSFVYLEGSYSVPCVFQVWSRSLSPRKKIRPKYESDLFEFVDKSRADFAIRRVGGLAGKLIFEFETYKESSHYFIRVKRKKSQVIKRLKEGYSCLNSIAGNCAGNPSLSKHELITFLENGI